MPIKGYQLICPKSYPDAVPPVVYSSIAIDNLSDLFSEEITTSFQYPSEERISWRVKKFPKGIEDFADWMCRASEITAKFDTYYFPSDGSAAFDVPVFFDTRTEVSSVDSVGPVDPAAEKSSFPVLRGNIDYIPPYGQEIPLGDPRIKHGGSKDFSMGGSIDLYDSSQPFLSSLAATTSDPQFGYQKSGPTGEGFNIWPSRETIRMFLFKGDFYVAVPFRYNTSETYIIEFDLEVSYRKIKVTLFARTFAFAGAGGITEYTITDTFA
jgi:hypothetical protein